MPSFNIQGSTGHSLVVPTTSQQLQRSAHASQISQPNSLVQNNKSPSVNGI